ncbi:MAG TPA: hypothetical protein VF174_08630, partial [Micromonosporaceae bacterium]
MSAQRKKGTAWETAIVQYLRANGANHAERRSLHGMQDRGDIAGVPGVVIEAKAGAWRPEWMDKAEVERRNDGHAPVAVVWHKRRGKASPGDGFVTMTGAQFVNLLRQAAYLPETPESLLSPPGAETQTPAPGGRGWYVFHPGLGSIEYGTREEAVAAAGTAGIVWTTTPGEAGVTAPDEPTAEHRVTFSGLSDGSVEWTCRCGAGRVAAHPAAAEAEADAHALPRDEH